MRRQTWLLMGGLVVVVAVMGALLWQPPGAGLPPLPLPPVTDALPTAPTGAAPATAPAAPATTPTAPPTPAPTLPPLLPTGAGVFELGDGLALTLAADWQGALQPAPAALGFADPNGVALLAAWQGAASYWDAPLRMTLVRTPRASISLPAYLDGLAATLGAAPGFVLLQQQITTTLRSDGLPAAEIRYMEDAAGAPRYGQQVALIDASGEHLLLLTISAAADLADTAEEQLRSAVASIRFGE